MPDLAAAIAELDALAAAWGPLRHTSAPANDAFEAAQDWANLGRLLRENAPRTDFAFRAQQEQDLHDRLRASLKNAPEPEQSRTTRLLALGETLIAAAKSRRPDPNGYLGIASIARAAFGALLQHGFALSQPSPATVQFTSKTVVITLSVDNDRESSFTLGPIADPAARYPLADLLFLHGDDRWRDLTGTAPLANDADVQVWFNHLAALFDDHGAEVLAGAPDLFARLVRAQADRDTAFASDMQARFVRTV